MKRTYAAEVAIVLSLGCYSYVQIKDAECKVYCKSAAGYDSGVYYGGKCWCADKIEVETLNEKKLIAPNKVITTKTILGD